MISPATLWQFDGRRAQTRTIMAEVDATRVRGSAEPIDKILGNDIWSFIDISFIDYAKTETRSSTFGGIPDSALTGGRRTSRLRNYAPS